MGKNSRERKLVKIEQELEEKRLAEERRRERIAPYYRFMKRFVLAAIATAVLLYIGLVVNTHIPSIANRILNKGL